MAPSSDQFGSFTDSLCLPDGGGDEGCRPTTGMEAVALVGRRPRRPPAGRVAREGRRRSLASTQEIKSGNAWIYPSFCCRSSQPQGRRGYLPTRAAASALVPLLAVKVASGSATALALPRLDQAGVPPDRFVVLEEHPVCRLPRELLDRRAVCALRLLSWRADQSARRPTGSGDEEAGMLDAGRTGRISSGRHHPSNKGQRPLALGRRRPGEVPASHDPCWLLLLWHPMHSFVLNRHWAPQNSPPQSRPNRSCRANGSRWPLAAASSRSRPEGRCSLLVVALRSCCCRSDTPAVVCAPARPSRPPAAAPCQPPPIVFVPSNLHWCVQSCLTCWCVFSL
jgi:hypothetical protein